VTRLDLPHSVSALAALLANPDVQAVTIEERDGGPVELGLLRRSTLATAWFYGRDLAEAVNRARDTFRPRTAEVEHE
jgi:hypothetical protein